MEQPPPAIPAMNAAATPQPHHTNHYPDSIDSSPRSRAADTWDDPQPPPPRLRLMCSYGGHIVPRPHDKSLCYVGGETRIVVADRNSSLSDLSAKLSKTLLAGKSFALKYQLPSEDLDSLISVTTDEDLDNMIDEYDRTKPNRLRLFLFSAAAVKPNESASSKSNDESDDWFVAALNGGGTGSGANNIVNNNNNGSSASVNCLLGLDDDGFIGDGSNHSAVASVETAAAIQQQKKAQETQSVSVPDSPMLDTTSSFGSTSSSPSLANLPPIRVHLADGGFQDQKTVPIEDHFSQMNIAAVAVRQDESSAAAASGFLVLSSPPSTALNPIAVSSSLSAPASSAGIGIEYAATNRDLISDDERSDHGGGIPIGYRKQQSSLSHKQTITTGGVMDLPSPDSVSSDSSFGNPNTIQHRSKGFGFEQQNPIFQIPTKLNNDNNNIISDYAFQQQQFELPQPQQFVQHHHPGAGSGGAHYIHHHNPAAYYHPVYTSQPPPQQHHHQYPVYYLPARQPYNNMSVQSATTAGAPPSLVHVGSSGQHYNIHPSSAQYEYGGGDQGRAQIYYTQPLGPPSVAAQPPQYQTMTADGINQQQQQQMRTSQPSQPL